MSLQTQIIAALVAFITVVAAGALWGEHRADQAEEATATRYKAAIVELKLAASAKLAKEKDKVAEREAALQEAKDQQELKDATYQKTTADLSDRLRRAAGPAGRLRDPHAPGCGASSGGATSQAAAATAGGAADPAEAGGLLSVPLTDLLAEVLRESDEINIAYASCRADAYTVRTEQPK